MKNFCTKHNITESQFLGKTEIGGHLDLSSLTSIPEGFNPTVGGYLDLRSLTSIPEGFNPTVGYLDLRSLTSIPEGFNPTVGGYLDLSSLTSIPEGFNINDFQHKNISLISWQDGAYIKCDDRFSEVVSKKGNVYKLKDVNKNNHYYLLTDGNSKYAHGDTIKEAKADLIYKISNRDKAEYKETPTDKKQSFAKCIEMYRVITGACSTGVRNFIESKGIKQKSFSVKEIAKITEGAYGNRDFINFFGL